MSHGYHEQDGTMPFRPRSEDIVYEDPAVSSTAHEEYDDEPVAVYDVNAGSTGGAYVPPTKAYEPVAFEPPATAAQTFEPERPATPVPAPQTFEPQAPAPQTYTPQTFEPQAPQAAPAVALAEPARPAAPTPSATTFAPEPPRQAGPPPMPGAGAAASSGGVAAAPSTSSSGRSSTEQGLREDDLNLSEVLANMLERGASDLHLTSGAHPTIRVRGELVPLDEYPLLNPAVLQRVLYAMMNQKQRERYEETLELDFSHSLPGQARFRVNVFRQRESIGAVFRTIPFEILALEKLGIPPVVGKFASLPRGLVLVTGPTGSGKSTTLAAILDLANRTRHDHIMTVEDPIEFLHQHKKCLVNQREVGEDTKSFANALKHVLRQDPDIILVGEMRDLETISVALTAAETGHLVFGTLHTQDAAQTIDRVIDVFPSEQQEQIRVMLAGSIQGVVCQTLCKTADGRGRAAATEVMVATPAIRNLVREGKTHQIYSAMQAGAQHGMHTLDQHLAELVRTNRISYEMGLEKCHHVEDFNRLTGRA